MTEPIKQVVFGGVLVPENAKRETVVDNGQTMYCVWLNDKGAKITYPEHQQKPVTTEFIKTIHYPNGFATRYDNRPVNVKITEAEFAKYEKEALISEKYGFGDYDIDTLDFSGNGSITTIKAFAKTLGGRTVNHESYYKSVDTHYHNQPRIDMREGDIVDFYELRNMNNAEFKGSSKCESINLFHSSECTLDVNDGNLDIINGDIQNNKIISDSEDSVL